MKGRTGTTGKSRVVGRLMGRLLPLFLLGAGMLMKGASAQSPRLLTRGLPQGAQVMLESDDLRALLTRWRDSPVRKAYLKSPARKDLERSKLYLRLLSRLEAMEEVTGFPIDLDRLIRGVGQRGAFGLYDIGETSFLLATDLPTADARRSDLLGLRGKLSPREHRGIAYFVTQAPPAPEDSSREKKRPTLCVAMLGSRLLFGNDLVRFQDALVLTAMDLGQKVAPPAAGVSRPVPVPASADPVHQALMPAAEALAGRAPLRIYVARTALAGNRYFDLYWIFGPETTSGISGALLALSLDEVTVETRAYAYESSAAVPALLAKDGDIGRTDVGKLAAALPQKPPYAQVVLADAQTAAGLIAELLPIPGGPGGPGGKDSHRAGSRAGRSVGNDDNGTGEPGDGVRALVSALELAVPHRVLEIADPQQAGMMSRHRGALAVGLRRGAALDAPRLERALCSLLEVPLGAGHGAPPLSFADDKGMRVLRLPLLSGWALSWQRRGDVLYVATDPDGLEQLAGSSQSMGPLLQDGGPLLRRVELGRAQGYFQGLVKTLTQRDNWSGGEDAELYGKTVASLPDLVKPVRRVLSAAYRRGPLVIEEVQYLP